jgi:hypothetical protein
LTYWKKSHVLCFLCFENSFVCIKKRQEFGWALSWAEYTYITMRGHKYPSKLSRMHTRQ